MQHHLVYIRQRPELIASEVEPLRLALAALHLKCVEILYKYEFSYLDVKPIKLTATVGKSGASWRADVVN